MRSRDLVLCLSFAERDLDRDAPLLVVEACSVLPRPPVAVPLPRPDLERFTVGDLDSDCALPSVLLLVESAPKVGVADGPAGEEGGSRPDGDWWLLGDLKDLERAEGVEEDCEGDPFLDGLLREGVSKDRRGGRERDGVAELY